MKSHALGSHPTRVSTLPPAKNRGRISKQKNYMTVWRLSLFLFYNIFMAKQDPRKKYPKLRNDLRKKVFATQDVCGICGRPVDKTLPAGTPMSPELDEIIPVARGGSPHDIDNLQLTHRICNQRKGARMDGDDIPQGLNPTPMSREW